VAKQQVQLRDQQIVLFDQVLKDWQQLFQFL
jgi:hypothetical protein